MNATLASEKVNTMNNNLSPSERQVRSNVRNLLCGATREEIVRELEISRERRDTLRSRFVKEYLDDFDRETK